MPVKRVRPLAMTLAPAALCAACATARIDRLPDGQPNDVPRDRLWHLVHDVCMPAAVQGTYPPQPCAEVDLSRGMANAYAVIKDRTGRFQYLVLPLARITGIESPALPAADAPNYFAAAWNARFYVEAAAHRHLPREALVLIVNAPSGRSQDHLHIHVGCIRPDVRDILQRRLPTLDERWQPLAEPLPPHAHEYLARWLPGESLTLDPFKSLMAALPTDDRMALHSLAIAGARAADGRPGFVLLSTKVDLAKDNNGNSDGLQDLNCTVADEAVR